MRTLILIAALAATAFGNDNPSKAPLPRKAPELVIQMADGSPQKLLSSYRGKVLAVAFMYTTCPHCQNTAKLLTKIQADYTGKDVQILGVTFDQGASLRTLQFVKGLGLTFPCGFSNGAPVLDFLGIPQDAPFFVPGIAFIDRQGMIRSQFVGDEKFLGEATVKTAAVTRTLSADEAQVANIKAEIDKLLKMRTPVAKK